MRNVTIMLNLICLFAIVFISEKAAAQTDEWLLQEYYLPVEHVLYQDKSVAVYDSLCSVSKWSILAGSVYTIGLLHTPEEVRIESPAEWPTGYYVEAALDIPEGGVFFLTKGLVKRLSPTTYWANVPSFGVPGNHPNINFSFYIPEDLAGHTLDFHLCYDDPDSQYEYQSKYWSLCVTPPIDKTDSARVMTSYIVQAFDMGNNYRVIEFADSMLKLGQSDCWGWLLARFAAKNIHSYDKAVIYLDKLWEDFGRTAMQLSGYGHCRSNPYAKQDSVRVQQYEDRRNELLELKAEWQKQH